MKKFSSLLVFIILNLSAYAQDDYSHVFFANQSRLPIQLNISVSGNTTIVESMKKDFLPYEITHDHSSTIAIGDIIGIEEKDHNENNASLKFDRKRFLGENNFSARIEVRTGSDLLFTILTFGEDRPGLFTRIFYNIEYPDGTLELTAPGNILKDNSGVKAQVASREIIYQNQAYKLVFGVFDEKADKTDNIIFSMSNVLDTIYRYEPPIADTANPNILHVVTYNPGILMPLDISDQDEHERAEVMHKALPKNMDIIVFQEFFEPKKTAQILDSLSPWYPYHTGAHNKVLIPGIGKEGGVRIVSKYPILEEDEISYSENGCVPEDFFSLFANKGVKYAKINKKGQMLHVFGTHTSLQPCDLYIMGQFIASKNIPQEEVVIMAGDFNVDMNRYKNGSDDYTIMLDTINALEPTYLSFLNDWTYTGTSSGLNHMYCCNPHSRQQLDYVFVSAKHKIPYLLTNRTMQARLNEPDASFGIFDMGDHEPVYARIEFPEIQSSSRQFSECIGNTIILTAEIIQPAPGAYFQWYKNEQEIAGANTQELEISVTNSDDFGIYSCNYLYDYLPDTVINNFFDSSYMDYNWYFRGVTQGKVSVDFSVLPSDSSVECSGVATSIYQREWNQLSLYPNPAHTSLFLRGDMLTQFKSFSIIDVTGRHLPVKNIPSISNIMEFEIGNLPSGMYFLVGQHQTDGIYQKSFVKH